MSTSQKFSIKRRERRKTEKKDETLSTGSYSAAVRDSCVSPVILSRPREDSPSFQGTDGLEDDLKGVPTILKRTYKTSVEVKENSNPPTMLTDPVRLRSILN